MTIELFLFVIAAYLVGSIPSAYLAVRWARGIDIRQHGTGNVGASNVLKLTNIWLTMAVTIFDAGKGALIVWLAGQLGMDVTTQAIAGMAAIVGHNWPLFLNFRGGRGILTSLGVITALSPPIGLIVLVGAYILAPIKQLALGVFLALGVLPFLSWFGADVFNVEDRLPVTLCFVAITLLAYCRRIFLRRTELSQTVHPLRLVINRILFDRDISDRKAWINRSPSSSQK